jgi:hypothetical protein
MRWSYLDSLLVKLWESPSIRPQLLLLYETGPGRALAEYLLPEVMKREFFATNDS